MELYKKSTSCSTTSCSTTSFDQNYRKKSIKDKKRKRFVETPLEESSFKNNGSKNVGSSNDKISRRNSSGLKNNNSLSEEKSTEADKISKGTTQFDACGAKEEKNRVVSNSSIQTTSKNNNNNNSSWMMTYFKNLLSDVSIHNIEELPEINQKLMNWKTMNPRNKGLNRVERSNSFVTPNVRQDISDSKKGHARENTGVKLETSRDENEDDNFTISPGKPQDDVEIKEDGVFPKMEIKPYYLYLSANYDTNNIKKNPGTTVDFTVEIESIMQNQILNNRVPSVRPIVEPVLGSVGIKKEEEEENTPTHNPEPSNPKKQASNKDNVRRNATDSPLDSIARETNTILNNTRDDTISTEKNTFETVEQGLSSLSRDFTEAPFEKPSFEKPSPASMFASNSVATPIEERVEKSIPSDKSPWGSKNHAKNQPILATATRKKSKKHQTTHPKRNNTKQQVLVLVLLSILQTKPEIEKICASWRSSKRGLTNRIKEGFELAQKHKMFAFISNDYIFGELKIPTLKKQYDDQEHVRKVVGLK